MNKKILFAIFVAITLTIITTIILIKPQTTKASPALLDTPESRIIQDVIRRSYEIEAIAARTFDTSQFSTVFANDPVGKLSSSTIQFIREATAATDELGFLDTKADGDLGYLDYKLAYYIWWKKGAEKFETLQAAAEQENRDLTQEESESLIDSSGRVAAPRAEGDATIPDLKFLSIEIDGDIAWAVFDDGPRTIQMTLVKRNGQWYLAGGAKMLEFSP